MATNRHYSDVFTVAASGTTIDQTACPLTYFGLAVKGTGGAPTAFNVVLEGSLDGTNWTTILTATEATPGDGKIIWQAAGIANTVMYIRSRLVSITLGPASNVVARWVGVI